MFFFLRFRGCVIVRPFPLELFLFKVRVIVLFLPRYIAFEIIGDEKERGSDDDERRRRTKEGEESKEEKEGGFFSPASFLLSSFNKLTW